MNMNLQAHASDNIPEWEKKNPEEWNKWQRLAADTNGWFTRANGATGLGLLASIGSGVAFFMNHPVVGTALLAAEGALDVVDGELAERDEVRNPRGKKLDAGSDKIRVPLQLFAAAKMGFMPIGAAVAMGATEAAIAVPSAIAMKNGNEPEVSSPGKIKAFLERLATGTLQYRQQWD